MKKRIWSLLLALILVCSLLPGAALAENEAAPPADGTVKTVGQLQYTAKDGTWTLTRYTGGASGVSIPSKVDNFDVTAIGELAFSNRELTSVSIPKTVTTIGKEAFNECARLATVTIAAGGLTTIGELAFNKCGALTGVTLPYGVTSIGNSAFSECTKLTDIGLPDTLTSIGDEAFFSTGLTKITIPGSVTTMGNSVFQGCASLATVTLGGGLTAIGKGMFTGCSRMTKLVIPSTVESIGESAFQNSGLTVLILPETVTRIGERAFFNCANLQNLCIPSKVTALPADAITGCTKLTVIHYTGAGDLGGLPQDAEGKDAIEVHHATASTTKKTNSTCSVEGTEESTVACKVPGCKSSLPTEIRPIAKTEHAFEKVPAVAATCVASGKTEGEECARCQTVKAAQETIPPLGHDPTPTDVLIDHKDATCTEEGYDAYAQKCTRCGEAVSALDVRPIEKTAHVEAADPVEITTEDTKEVTCGEDGVKVWQKVCKDCGASIGDPWKETLAATGQHTWGDPVIEITKKPTCTEKGEQVEKVVCTVCGAEELKETTELDVTDHRYDPKDAVDVEGGVLEEPTCTDPGRKNMKVICADCRQEVIVEVEIPALGHDFGAGTEEVIQKPTCTEKGIKAIGYAECSRCDATQQTSTEEIPALGHERTETVKDETRSKEPTCTEPGYETILATVCAREDCDEEIPEERVELPALNHETGGGLEETVTKEPTCTEPGTKHVATTCTRCGEALQAVDFEIDPTGHTFGEWVVTKTATATVPGSRERTCSVCQEKETEVIPAGNGSTEDPSDPETPEDPKDPEDPTVTYYDVDLIRSTNGSVSAVSRAAAGDTVTLTVRPYSGYELDSIEVTRWNSGRAVRLSGGSSNRYTFTMPSDHVEVRAYFSRIPSYSGSSSSSGWYPSSSDTAAAPAAPQVVIQPAPQAGSAATGFSDVPASHWASGEISWAYRNGYMSGVGNGRFNPGGSITSQQLWMVLARFMGANPANMEAARFWAVENGFAEGTNPASPVTRQQMVVALYRTARLTGSLNSSVASLTNFVDSRNVAASARNAMGWAVANGIISGNADACLNPNGTVTRDQFAVFLYRFTMRR